MRPLRNMQGTTSYCAAIALLVLCAYTKEVASAVLSTSTTFVATTTITVTLDSATLRSFAQLSHTTVPLPLNALVADSDTSLHSNSPTATRTITLTTTIKMSSDSLQSQALNSTNQWRSRHMADPVQWNESLADYAHDWAKGCVWEHSGGPHGENLAAGFENATLAIDAWGNEEEKYNYKKGKFTEDTGHFSQLVWRNTTSIGCAEVECDTDGEKGVQGKYLVCEYNPAGNVQGQFKYNVMKSGMDEDGNPGFGSDGTRMRSSPRMLLLALVVAWTMVSLVL